MLVQIMLVQIIRKPVYRKSHCRGVLLYAPTKDNNQLRYGLMSRQESWQMRSRTPQHKGIL